MSLIVLKFGGTSVGSIKKINYAAKIIKKYHDRNNKIIVVSSAMSGATNNLIKKSKEISKNFDKFEYDVLLSSGEQVACALLSGALINMGLKARSWLSWQIPIIVQGKSKASRIMSINKTEILKYIKSGGIPIVTGFQGIAENKRIATLGRGGSDATAISIAKFFGADDCIIYTDVDGVYTTDPKINKKAKKINKISYEEMLEMASLGAKVMQPISVQDAMVNDIDINVKSTFTNNEGTKILDNQKIFNKNIITGIAFTKNESKITLLGVIDRPGVAASIFKPLSDNQINVDMVVQNVSTNTGQTDITFTIRREDIKICIKTLKENKKISYKEIIHDDRVTKLSIIGAGMITTPGVTYRMFQALAKKRINIMVISTSEIKISVLINQKNLKEAVKVLHSEFDLD